MKWNVIGEKSKSRTKNGTKADQAPVDACS